VSAAWPRVHVAYGAAVNCDASPALWVLEPRHLFAP